MTSATETDERPTAPMDYADQFRETFLNGSAPVDTSDPHKARRSTTKRFDSATPLAPKFPGDDHSEWLVTRIDRQGKTTDLGSIDANATQAEFIHLFYDSMPADGEPAVTFSLLPVSFEGRHLADAGYNRFNVDSTHVLLKEERARQSRKSTATVAGVSVTSSGTEIALALMQQQLDKAEAERDRARGNLDAERAALLAERAELAQQRSALAQSAALDLGNAYSNLHVATQKVFEQNSNASGSAMNSVLTTQQELAKSERETRREEAIAERERLKAESIERQMQLRADNDAALERERERVRVEIARIDMEKERVRTEREDAKANLLLQMEADRQRRRDEKEEENRRQEREDKRRQDHELALETLRLTDQARRDAADAYDRQRREESLKDDRERQEKHFQLMLETVREREKKENNADPMKFVKGIVDELGGTIGVVGLLSQGAAFVKDLLAGGEKQGILATLIDRAGGLLEKVVDRLPLGEEEEPEEEVEPEEDEAEVREREAALKRKRIARRAQQAEELKKEEAKKAEKEGKEGKEPKKLVDGAGDEPVNLGNLFGKKAVPVGASTEAEGTAPVPAAPEKAVAAAAQAEIIAQRAAVLDFLASLEGVDVPKWPTLVPADKAVLQQIVTRVTTVGLTKVIEEAGYPAEMLEDLRMLMAQHLPFLGGVVPVEIVRRGA